MAFNAMFGFGVADDKSEMVTQNTSNGVTPEFVITVQPNVIKAKEEGRPIFDEVETVILHVAGDSWNHVSKPVDDAVKQRFPIQYAAWKANRTESMTATGTPLSQWPAINAAQVKEMEAINIYNVEGLASVADINLSKSHSLRQLRDKAAAYLDAAKNGAGTSQLVEENAAMKDQLAQLTAKFAAMEALQEAKKIKNVAKMAKARSAKKAVPADA